MVKAGGSGGNWWWLGNMVVEGSSGGELGRWWGCRGAGRWKLLNTCAIEGMTFFISLWALIQDATQRLRLKEDCFWIVVDTLKGYRHLEVLQSPLGSKSPSWTTVTYMDYSYF